MAKYEFAYEAPKSEASANVTITLMPRFWTELSKSPKFLSIGWLYLPACGPDGTISAVGAERFTRSMFAPASARASSAFSLASPASSEGKFTPMPRMFCEPLK